MKTIPSKILTAVAAATLLTSATGAWAQGGPTPSPTPSATATEAMEKTEHKNHETGDAATRTPRAGAPLEALTKALDLTPEQAEKIKPILESQREKVRAAREEKSDSPEATRTKIAEIRAASKKEIDAVLTPEQQKKFESMRAGAAGSHRGGSKEKHTKVHDEKVPSEAPSTPAPSATP